MITVVTVCYNAEDTIEETIHSVIEQTYSNKEYLIIDGNSTDRTLDIIKKYQNYDYISVISETDKGLYDAMNKSLDMADGDYIIFLNSGDQFCDKDVLSDIEQYLGADLVYGNVVRRKENGDLLEKYPGKYRLFWLLLQGKMVSHQVIFTRLEIMKQYRFDLSYKITADFNFLVRAVHDRCSFRYVDRNVSIMENRFGISAQEENMGVMREEDDRSLREYFPVWYWMLRPVKFLKRKLF